VLPAGALPFTGSDANTMLELAGALLAVGAAAASRRRRTSV
jgi:LPXTG-motif cell wall-anchored protein